VEEEKADAKFQDADCGDAAKVSGKLSTRRGFRG